MRRRSSWGTKLSERIVSRDEIFSGRIVRLVVDRVELPDGSEASRELVLHPGAVAILPILDDGRIILVRQYRHAIGGELLEVPAGKLDVEGESPQECAARELREETGYVASDWEEICTFYTSPGFTNERIVLFRATGLRRVGSPAPGEIAGIELVAPGDIPKMIATGELVDGKTLIALSWRNGVNG